MFFLIEEEETQHADRKAGLDLVLCGVMRFFVCNYSF